MIKIIGKSPLQRILDYLVKKASEKAAKKLSKIRLILR